MKSIFIKQNKEDILKNHHPKTTIVQMDKEGNVVREYASSAEVREALQRTNITNVFNVLEVRQKTAYGYVWKYKKDLDTLGKNVDDKSYSKTKGVLNIRDTVAKSLLLLLSLIVSITTFSQVTIMDDTPVNEEIIPEHYDSLSNCRLMNHGDDLDYCHLIGQTIIYCGAPYVPAINNKALKVGDSYFVLNKVQENSSLFGIYTIQNTKTKTIIKENLGVDANQYWVVQGYLDKLRDMYVGKDYLYVGGKYNSKMIDCLISIANHQPNRDVKYHSIWKCIDSQIKPRNANDGMLNDARSPVVIVFENPQYGKHYCYFENEAGIPRNFETPQAPPLFVEMKNEQPTNDIGSGHSPGAGSGNGGGIGFGTGGHRGMITNIDATINQEGQVCVEVHIAADGHVIDARVINNSKYKTTVTDRNVQQQCVARAKQILYKPGKEELRIIVFQ